MRRKWKLVLVVLLVAVLAAGIGCKMYMDSHIRVAGKWISLDAAWVDLRGEELSLEEFQQLQARLPDCDILWDVPFQGKRVDSASEELQVSSLTEEDLEMLEYFPNLKLLDAAQCENYEALLAFHAEHTDCRVHYQVVLGSSAWAEDATVVTVQDANAQELLNKLRVLPEATRVELTGTLPTLEEMALLRNTYPNVTFVYEIFFQDKGIRNDAVLLDLSGKVLSDGEAENLLAWLPQVQKVDMRGCSLSDEEIMALADAYPQAFFLWEMTLFDEFVVSTDAEELDISGYPMKHTQEIESLLPYFPNLKKVVMCGCGFDDETMDALNQRYEDIRFVWNIKVRGYDIRTDTTFFYPFTLSHTLEVFTDDLYPLRYCTDIVAIDIGHNWGVKNCDWAAYMPNLTYLIIGDTGISDITPLTGLKNLAYLEIWGTNIKDYSPLVTCTSLVDLNLTRTYGHWEPISKMTWLENLWWNGLQQKSNRNYDPALVNTEEELSAYLPNTNMQFGSGSSVVNNGWRKLDNYKKMRDVMGMFYLD